VADSVRLATNLTQYHDVQKKVSTICQTCICRCKEYAIVLLLKNMMQTFAPTSLLTTTNVNQASMLIYEQLRFEHLF